MDSGEFLDFILNNADDIKDKIQKIKNDIECVAACDIILKSLNLLIYMINDDYETPEETISAFISAVAKIYPATPELTEEFKRILTHIEKINQPKSDAKIKQLFNLLNNQLSENTNQFKLIKSLIHAGNYDKFVAAVDDFLKNKSNLNYRSEFEGVNLLMYSTNYDSKYAKYFISKGVDPNLQTKIGETALIWILVGPIKSYMVGLSDYNIENFIYLWSLTDKKIKNIDNNDVYFYIDFYEKLIFHGKQYKDLYDILRDFNQIE